MSDIISSGFIAEKGASTEHYQKKGISGSRSISQMEDPREEDFRIRAGQRVEIKPPTGYRSRIKMATVRSVNEFKETAEIIPDGTDTSVVVPLKYIIPESIRNKYYIKKVGEKKGNGDDIKDSAEVLSAVARRKGAVGGAGSSAVGETVNRVPSTGSDPHAVNLFFPAGRKKEAKVQGDHEFASSGALSDLSSTDKYKGHKLEANKIIDRRIVSREVGSASLEENNSMGDIPVELMGGKVAKDGSGQGTSHPDIDPNIEKNVDDNIGEEISNILENALSSKDHEHFDIQDSKEKGRLNSGMMISRYTNAPVHKKQDSDPFSEDITGDYNDIVEKAKDEAPTIIVAKTKKEEDIIGDVVQGILNEKAEKKEGVVSASIAIDERKIIGKCRSFLEKKFADCWGTAINYDSLDVSVTPSKEKVARGNPPKFIAVASVDTFLVNEGKTLPLRLGFNYTDTLKGDITLKTAVIGIRDGMGVSVDELNESVLHEVYKEYHKE